MNCQTCELFLEEFLDGQLEPKTREVFEAHYQECALCHRLVEDARFAGTLTRAAFPAREWEVSPQFFSRLWHSIESEQNKPFSWVAVRNLAFRFVFGVALILALLAGIDVVNRPRLNDNQAAIEHYLEAPGAPETFRDVLVGDIATNRDELIRNLLQRDRQQSASPLTTHEAYRRPPQKK